MTGMLSKTGGAAITIVDSATSSSDLVWAAAAQDAPSGTAFLVREQTAGRGRRGTGWSSARGGMYFSILLRPAISQRLWFGLSFVAALAIRQELARCLADVPVMLKWPNDVLVGGAKISGILLESGAASGAHLDWVCVGMGLNLAHYPDDTPYLATSIAAHTGHRPGNLSTLEVLASAFERYYQQWQQFGFSVIVTKWRQQAHNLGREITVRLENSELTGVFEDIDETGALLLCAEDGQHHIVSAGDVFFR